MANSNTKHSSWGSSQEEELAADVHASVGTDDADLLAEWLYSGQGLELPLLGSALDASMTLG